MEDGLVQLSASVAEQNFGWYSLTYVSGPEVPFADAIGA
jgi:hypothetical protein